MKRALSLLFVILLSAVAFAQTQKGIVRTPGRENKKSQVLANTVVRAVGVHNAVKSDKSGVFALSLTNVKNGTFQISNVQKSGYTIFDKGITFPKTYPVSNVPIEIVLIKIDDLEREKQEWLDRGYNNAEKEYKKKLSALQEDFKALKITEEEHSKRLRELEDWYEKYQSLVNGMAEFYVHVDFNSLDEGLTRITKAIADGEYMLADSLINVYAPNLEGDVEQSIKAQTAIRESRALGESIVAKAISDSIELAQKNERTASFLYAKYTTSVSDNRWNDALHYLKLRADLDNTNLSWINEYANLCNKLQLYDDAILYYEMGAKIAQEAGREDIAIDLLGNVSYIYNLCEQFDEGFALLTDLIERADSIEKVNPDCFKNLGNLYWQLGNYYQRQNQYELAVRYLKMSNEKGMNFGNVSEMEGEFCRATNLSVIGITYCNMLKPDEGLSYLQNARVLLDSLYIKYPQKRDLDTEGQIERGFGLAYDLLQEYETSLKHHKNAYEIHKALWRKAPDAYSPYLAETCKVLGTTYFYVGDFDSSMKYLEESAALFKDVQSKDPQFLLTGYCDVLNNIGYLNYIIGDYEKANSSYDTSYSILHPLYEKYPDAYVYHYVLVLINQFSVFRAQGKLDMCDKMMEETEQLADVVYEQMADAFALSMTIMYKEYAQYYMMMENKELAKQYLDKAATVSPNDSEIQILFDELKTIE